MSCCETFFMISCLNFISKMSANKVQTVLVVGGGLVGSLCAIFLAKRGYHVSIFEYREDIRSSEAVRGRSINLALSSRGRNALKIVSLEDLILETAIPMKGRFLHELNGQTRSVPYDSRSGQCIYSISRNHLHKILITEFEKYPNTKIYFNYKLIHVNFEEEALIFLNVKTQEQKIYYGDLIIGADGAFSAVRRFMQITPMFEFSQSYIQHAYIELRIPPKNGHKVVPNHLHVWPRNDFMMIALPNIDHSWTVTLFMPLRHFNRLEDGNQLMDFFKKVFPDAIPLIGEELLMADFFKVKPSCLIYIKCNPYHMGRKFLIIGDAAHAMVPFYGQGMNAGFEDCSLLDSILTTNNDDIPRSIREFSAMRKEDAHAICDLALYNYEEMKNLVTKRSFYLRKTFDDILFKFFPNTWVPIYNSVTFSNMGYKQCVENRKWQNKVIQKILGTGVFLSVGVLAYFTNLMGIF